MKGINAKPIKWLVLGISIVILAVILVAEISRLGLPGTISYDWRYGISSIIFLYVFTAIPFVALAVWVVYKYRNSKITYIAIGLFVLSYCIRILMADFLSADYYWYLRCWIEEYKTLPLAECFAKQVGNYSPAYNYILIIFSRLPVYDLYLLKTFSFYFEIASAIMIVKIIAIARQEKVNPIHIAITLLLLMPMINSSQWAQCDAVYSFFAIAAIYFAMNKKSILCFVFMGIGLAIKLHIILIYPVVLILLICKNTQGEKYLYWRHIWYTPVACMGISILPALFGGSPFKILKAYANQIIVGNESHALVGNCANIFLYLRDIERSSVLYPLLTFVFIGVVALMLTFVICRVYKSKKNSLELKDILLLCAFMPLFEVYFMPKMLDRFFYMAEIFAFAYMMIFDHKDKSKIMWAYLLFEFGVMITYAYVMGLNYFLVVYFMAPIYVGASLILMTIEFMRTFRKKYELIG